MAEFNIRADSVDVEQIMTQIRTRIREKRGVDYTEEQVRELASVRLEKFLDPKNLRSDLLEQFRKSRPALPEPPQEPPPVEPPYAFDDETLFQSHRGPLRLVRRLLKPVLKLFFNPNTLNQVLHTQAQFNVDMLKRDLRRRVEFQQQVASFERSRGEWNLLYYEVLHNLVLETTRNGIELKNLKMRVESLASRLDFSERRVRALEGVVQYRPEVVRPRPAGGRADEVRDRGRDHTWQGDGGVPAPDDPATLVTPPGPQVAESSTGGPPQGAPGEATGRRRRRRRRGRRSGMPVPGAVGSPPIAESTEAADDDPDGDEDQETAADVSTDDDDDAA
jgi:hypothetical protein